MNRISDFHVKAIKKASREATQSVKGWTRIVTSSKSKKDKKMPTRHYLQEM
jgi:hypothetical protein